LPIFRSIRLCDTTYGISRSVVWKRRNLHAPAAVISDKALRTHGITGGTVGPRTVWTFTRSEKSLASDVNRAPILPGCSLVTTQSELIGLSVASYCSCSKLPRTCHYWRTGHCSLQDKLKRNKHDYVFRNIVPCSLVNTCMYRWFRTTCCLKTRHLSSYSLPRKPEISLTSLIMLTELSQYYVNAWMTKHCQA
jgi:hypothetical protein